MLTGRAAGAPNGYWNFGGADAAGFTSVWLLQSRATLATSWEMAVTGVRAAHYFFYAATADLASLRNGVTLVLDMTGVSVAQLLAANGAQRKQMKAIGDPYTHIIPLRPQAVYVVGCSMTLRPVFWLSLSALSSKLKKRVSFVRGYEELAAMVPRASWPAALLPNDDEAVTPTVQQTAEHARRRIDAFEKQCDEMLE